MSIKPCPACESDESHLGWAFDGSEQQRVCCSCDMAGPSASCAAEADAAWNALPRRGDGLAWRSEPPDRPGTWLESVGPRWSLNIHRLNEDGVSVFGEAGSRHGVQWYGPIPERPAPDAEKEAGEVTLNEIADELTDLHFLARAPEGVAKARERLVNVGGDYGLLVTIRFHPDLLEYFRLRIVLNLDAGLIHAAEDRTVLLNALYNAAFEVRAAARKQDPKEAAK